MMSFLIQNHLPYQCCSPYWIIMSVCLMTATVQHVPKKTAQSELAALLLLVV